MYACKANYRQILQVHIAPVHVHIFLWKQAKDSARFTLSSRVFHRKFPLRDMPLFTVEGGVEDIEGGLPLNICHSRGDRSKIGS